LPFFYIKPTDIQKLKRLGESATSACARQKIRANLKGYDDIITNLKEKNPQLFKNRHGVIMPEQ
jgi:hypothetical protein